MGKTRASRISTFFTEPSTRRHPPTLSPPCEIYAGEFTVATVSHRNHLGNTNLPHLFRLQTSPPYQTKYFIHRKPPGCQPQPPKKPTSNDSIGRFGLHRLRHRVSESIHRL
ncbi:hypothetical protein F2Q69_00036628 [Brassica cretica]|uniref:Uncharacterized protein n=1 Tax=Brassica cretica TaxID=69181 RepID=A0A8S9SC34_BRACR|nr:hypothetical protein F2Q69_00036628 [Brassica cretica]